jgi:hypothetical protein
MLLCRKEEKIASSVNFSMYTLEALCVCVCLSLSAFRKFLSERKSHRREKKKTGKEI